MSSFLCNSYKKQAEIFNIQGIDNFALKTYYVDNW